MSIESFTRWLDVASSDGYITVKERNALIDRAHQLGISLAEAELLIEQRIQQLKLQPPQCPECGHRFTSASITMLCPYCNADVSRARSKQEDGAGIIQNINDLEEAVHVITALAIPKVMLPRRFNHGQFQRLRSDVETRIDKIAVRYRDNSEVNDVLVKCRVKLEGVVKRYESSKRSFRYGAIAVAVIFFCNYAYQSYSQSILKARGLELQRNFKSLLDNKKFNEASSLLKDAKAEYNEIEESLPRGEARSVWVRFLGRRYYFKKSLFVFETDIELCDRKYKTWIEPIREKLMISCQKGDYDNCFAMVDYMRRDYVKYPTYPDDRDTEGPLGEDYTLQNIQSIIDQNDECMLMRAIERHDHARMRQVLSRVPDELRRTRLLKKAMVLAAQTGRVDVRQSLQALINNRATATTSRYVKE